MINVYFIPRGKGQSVGAISLKQYDPLIQADVWTPYAIIPITEKTILFKNQDNEFTVMVNESVRHRTGQIDVKYLSDGLLNVCVREM